jgi:hypothetical protein
METFDTPDPSYKETYRRLPELGKLRDTLSPLPSRHRLAFALCCCERLYPSYQALVALLQSPDLVRPILDRLWLHVLGQDVTDAEISDMLATCRSLRPGGECCREHLDDACDALGATYVTLEACRQHPLDNVVRAAEQVRNKTDRPLWKELAKGVVGGVGPEDYRRIEKAIRFHPKMVAEIEKEAAQLRFLYECNELTADTISQLVNL